MEGNKIFKSKSWELLQLNNFTTLFKDRWFKKMTMYNSLEKKVSS